MVKKKKSDKVSASAKVKDVLAVVRKAYGEDSITRIGDDTCLDIKVVSTGSLSLDLATGVGGLPCGRITEIYGPESCLASDTFISYEIKTKDGKRQNHKGGTIENLYRRFHGLNRKGRGAYQRASTANSLFYASSINEEGRVFKNLIVDVVKTGRKTCLLISAGKISIEPTADHRFWTGEKFVKAGEIKVGDVVHVHNNTRFKKAEEAEAKKANSRVYLYVKAHPVAGVKVIIDKKRGYRNEYHRLARSRAVVEAHMNDLALEEFVKKLNDNELEGLEFLSRDQHVHHIDEDHTNDDLGNLVVIDPGEHGRLHAIERHNDLRFASVPVKVTKIEMIGERDTYDIRMKSPFNNYVANKFVVHNSGKTTLALTVVRNAQREGGLCAFIDAEHAIDAIYARKIGVDMDKMLFSQPTTGEEALGIVDILLKTGELDVIVIDSVAALVPKAELDGEMGQSHVGLQARMMSQAMRKLTASISRTNCIVIFINQIREKIGVRFGCFHEDTPVMFADGSQHPIKEVVSGKLAGPVLSWDGSEIVERQIVDWHRNGVLNPKEEWLTFRVAGAGGKRGSIGFTCTKDHVLVSSDGREKHAKDFDLGDRLLSWFDSTLTGVEKEIIEGSLFGDGQLEFKPGARCSAGFSLANSEQRDYLQWKIGCFNSRSFSKVESCGRVSYRTERDFEMGLLISDFYPNDESSKKGFRTIPLKRLKKASLLTLAVWFMDDGCYKKSHKNASISVKRLSSIRGSEIAQILYERGFEAEYSLTMKAICFTVKGFTAFSAAVAPFVHNSMRYKLLPEHRELKAHTVIAELPIANRLTTPVEIIDIHTSKRKMRAKQRYDLSIEDDSFYLVGGDSRGVVVHNSPETTPGGKALKFYASMRLDIRRIGKVLEKDDTTGAKTRVRVKKNKVAPPFGEAEFEIKYNHGIFWEADILDLAMEWNIVQKKGAWFSTKEGRLGHGRAKVLENFLEDRELFGSIEAQVMDALYPPEPEIVNEPEKEEP